MTAMEELQKLVWQCNDIDVVPGDILLTAAHNGGLVLGAFLQERLIGMAFSFPGFYTTPDGPRIKHCSHILGIHPDFRDQNIGFYLKRAQWQMVRQQGIDRITWTFDPLGSRNANLNIAKLGAVCNTYLVNYYGAMQDGINQGLPSDRFKVDWWVYSRRVERRLSKKPRRAMTQTDFEKAEAPFLAKFSPLPELSPQKAPLLLVEIPADFQRLRATKPALALEWRLYTRDIFTDLFRSGYLVTDFVHEKETLKSFYVLTHGEATLQLS